MSIRKRFSFLANERTGRSLGFVLTLKLINSAEKTIAEIVKNILSTQAQIVSPHRDLYNVTGFLLVGMQFGWRLHHRLLS